jgi:hypothetical protein
MTSLTGVTIGGVPLPLDLVAGAVDQAVAGTKTTSAAKGTAAAKVGTAKTASTAKKTTAKATSTKKTTTSKTTTKTTTGYATNLTADYAFLRDPKLSIEEKLSRFIGLAMTKSEQDLQRQMEKMAPGSTSAGTAGATTASGSSTAAKPKSSKVSLWGLAKSLLPPLNLASQLVGGDAKLKALVTQVSGPVLAAAATAVGLPMLAPLAAKYGPTLVGALTKDISVDLAALGGGTSSAGAASTGGTSSTAASSTKANATDTSTSEKAQLMELQRLQDRDKELFSLFSNMLKAMHDSRMTCIQNIR